MEQNKKYFDDLIEVRKLMENSSKFISLSGLSGILAGIYALVGLYLVENYIATQYHEHNDFFYSNIWDLFQQHSFVFLVAIGVVTLSVISGILLTVFKAKQKNQTILDKIAIRMIVNLSIPVIAGGFFIVILIQNGVLDLIVPTTLIFYGLGLINGSKYTLNTIRNLGIIQIALGIGAGFFPEYDILFWALGFGVLHIIYGTFMWWKFERNA